MPRCGIEIRVSGSGFRAFRGDKLDLDSGFMNVILRCRDRQADLG